MKSLFLTVLMVISYNAFSQKINNTAWEVQSVSMSYKDPAAAVFLDQLVSKEFKGAIIVVQDGKFRYTKPEKTIASITNITADTIYAEVDGEKQAIKYKLSKDGQEGTFTFDNGSVLEAERIKMEEARQP